jgi:hypothetical protein
MIARARLRWLGEVRQIRGAQYGNIVTRFTERFGCKHPFACGGMAFAGMTLDLTLAVYREQIGRGLRIRQGILHRFHAGPRQRTLRRKAK